MLCPAEESKVKQELGDVRKYCEEGVTEGGACGDDEMQAEFLLLGVLLDMVDGAPVDDMKTALDVSVQYSYLFFYVGSFLA